MYKLKMRFSILYGILICQFHTIISPASALDDDNGEICPFKDTVNLTNHQNFKNGSYLYEDILIPPGKQKFYDFELKFLGARETVSPHLRGCVCDKRPCIKLCCNKNEYFNDHEDIKKCMELTSDMSVSQNLPINLRNNQSKDVNILEHFIPQVGFPCEEPAALDSNTDIWMLEENGILFVTSDDTKLNTLNYCYSPRLENGSTVYTLHPFSCPIEDLGTWRLFLNSYAMVASVVFLIPTIVVYLVLKELRGNLRGKLLISYLVSLTVPYTIISFINISGLQFNGIQCSLLGYTCYFFLVAAFLWMSVLSCDIRQNLKENKLEFKTPKSSTQFVWISLYTWFIAGGATIIIIFIQHADSVDDIYKPGIGLDMCWLNTDRWSALMYLYGPNLVILLFNLVIFVQITLKMYAVRRDLTRITNKEKFLRENASVIIRLFIIMGISWLFDIISYCVRDYKEWDILFILSDFINAIQGILIFILFVLKYNVRQLLKARFQKLIAGRRQRNFTTSTATLLRLQSTTSIAVADTYIK